jgi:hypothetical protein
LLGSRACARTRAHCCAPHVLCCVCVCVRECTTPLPTHTTQVDEPALREGLPLKKDKWASYLGWAVDAFRCSGSARAVLLGLRAARARAPCARGLRLGVVWRRRLCCGCGRVVMMLCVGALGALRGVCCVASNVVRRQGGTTCPAMHGACCRLHLGRALSICCGRRHHPHNTCTHRRVSTTPLHKGHLACLQCCRPPPVTVEG